MYHFSDIDDHHYWELNGNLDSKNNTLYFGTYNNAVRTSMTHYSLKYLKIRDNTNWVFSFMSPDCD